MAPKLRIPAPFRLLWVKAAPALDWLGRYTIVRDLLGVGVSSGLWAGVVKAFTSSWAIQALCICAGWAQCLLWQRLWRAFDEWRWRGEDSEEVFGILWGYETFRGVISAEPAPHCPACHARVRLPPNTGPAVVNGMPVRLDVLECAGEGCGYSIRVEWTPPEVIDRAWRTIEARNRRALGLGPGTGKPRF